MVVVNTDIRCDGGGMRQNARWMVAGLATAAAFSVPTWLCGAVVLPSLLKDLAIRWSLASALGAVLGSLAVLWGHAFATRATATETSSRLVQATADRAVAIGGDNQAPVLTGDAIAPAQPATSPAATGQPSAPPPAINTVSASGNRAIAIGSTNAGSLSTGDRPAGDPPGGAHP